MDLFMLQTHKPPTWTCLSDAELILNLFVYHRLTDDFCWYCRTSALNASIDLHFSHVCQGQFGPFNVLRHSSISILDLFFISSII